MLIAICGLPRAGKTTYSKQFEDIYPIIHMDKYTIEETISMVKDLDDVVLDGVLNTPIIRKAILRAYTGDKTQCIWLNTPKEIRKKRKGYFWFYEMHFEPPTYDEGWDEIIVI